jgi:hypothetical protein
LKLIRSPRAAADIRTGIEIKPNVMWPFHTLVAILSTPSATAKHVHALLRLAALRGGMQDEFTLLFANSHNDRS